MTTDWPYLWTTLISVVLQPDLAGENVPSCIYERAIVKFYLYLFRPFNLEPWLKKSTKFVALSL